MTVLLMTRRHRFSGRARGSTLKNQVWASALSSEVALGTLGQFELNMVQADDWSGTEGERGTLMTARGWLSVSADNDSTIAKDEGGIFWYIGVVSDEVPAGSAPNPGLPQTYVSPSILTTGGFLWGATAIGVHRNSQQWDINLKTKRTIRADQQIRFVLFNATTDTINLSIVTRSLMRKSG